MKNNILVIHLIMLFFSLISCEYKVSPVSSYSDNEFHLTNPEDTSLDKYFKIYLFKNDIKGEIKTDLVLQWKLAQGYTTKIAIYNQYVNIKQNEDGEFIDSIFEFKATEKEIIISDSDPNYIGNGDFYVVIYDLKYSYYDSFRIFNEADQIKLKNSFCYQIPHLYSQEKLIFHMENNAYNYIAFNMASESLNGPTLEIREDGLNGTLLKQYKESTQQEYIPISSTSQGHYLILYKEEGNEYDAEFNKTFCIEFIKKRITTIDDAITKKYSYSMSYYFMLDLSKFSNDEENSILLNLDYTPVEPFDGFYCKYVTLSGSEEELINQYPKTEDESECALQKDDIFDTLYHLFFKNSDKDKKALLVLVKVKGQHLQVASLKIENPITVVEIIGEQFFQYSNITVPLYYRIDPNKFENNFITATSQENVQSIIYNSLSNNKVVTKPQYRTQLFAFNKNEEKKPIIYIKLHGGIGTVDFEVIITPAPVIYVGSQVRPQSGFPFQINNCSQYYYLIANYAEKSNDFLSIDNIYGKGTVYHKDAYSPSKRLIENLPSESNGKLLNETIKLWNNVDLLKIACEIPMSIIINFSTQDKPGAVIQKGDSLRTMMDKQQVINFNVESSSQIGLTARIETDDSVVEVVVNGVKKKVLNKSNKVYKENIMTNTDETIKIGKTTQISFNSLSTSILSVQLGSNDLYKIIESQGKTKEQHVLIKLRKEPTNYYSAKVVISSSEKGLTFCLLQGFYKAMYVPLPKSNCNIDAFNYAIQVNNPFDKYIDDNISSDEDYFIAVKFNKVPSSDISIDLSYEDKELARQIEEGEVFILDQGIPILRTLKPKESSKEFILFSFTPCFNQEIIYDVLYNKISMSGPVVITKKEMILMKNNMTEIDLKFQTDSGIFSYNYVTQEDYDDYYPTKDYNVTATSYNNTVLLEFSPFVNGKMVNYSFYESETDDNKDKVDECILYSSKPFDVASIKTDGLIRHNITMSEFGTYKISILATTVEGITSTASYNSADIKVEKVEDDIKPDPKPDPEPDKKPEPVNWIWVMLGCIGIISVIATIVFVIIKVIKDKQQKNDVSSAAPFDVLI